MEMQVPCVENVYRATARVNGGITTCVFDITTYPSKYFLILNFISLVEI